MENILISINKVIINGFYTYVLEYVDSNMNPGSIRLLEFSWTKSEIVNALIRTRYPQDRVEAIINNHFLNIAEWLDKKFKGEDVVFEDLEYDKLQEWRKQCKQWADEALEKYPSIN